MSLGEVPTRRAFDSTRYLSFFPIPIEPSFFFSNALRFLFNNLFISSLSLSFLTL